MNSIDISNLIGNSIQSVGIGFVAIFGSVILLIVGVYIFRRGLAWLALSGGVHYLASRGIRKLRRR